MIIEGDLLHLRSGKDSFISRYVHLTLMSNILSHTSSSLSNTGPTVGLIPALDTKISKPPNTSIPLRTCPKTTCFPSSQSVLAVHMKNCDPFVFGPELAIDRVPGPVCFNSKFSSSNLLP
ncbi:hypothetical protein ALC57_16308 [Trachymyrmex cornetzi]|uniref:Uncharacterized protein n=1 Tax=Trachymyrmex cornetzi TaxID=471704 RepID=A0A195DF46_9HYME|nr:hypothetical protein ALC57_16308 [Trachymyrmex cornetzi]